MMKTRHGVSLVATLLLVLLLAHGVAGEDITLRLKWFHGAQFAGYYAAAEMGFYEDEGLHVAFIEGPTDFEQFSAVADGEFDFMVADALRVLQAPELGIPVVAIAAIYQTDPLVFISLAEEGILSPYELPGKTVMSYGVMLPALMDKLGIPIESLDVVGPSHDLEHLYSGEVDVWIGYITNEAVQVRLDGHEINIIHPSDYGVDVYGDALITSRRMLVESPDVALRFLRATLQGWEHVMFHPEESSLLALRFNPNLNLDHQAASLQASLPLLSSGRAPLGWIDRDRWQFVADTLLAQGQILAPIDLDLTFDTRLLEILAGEGG